MFYTAIDLRQLSRFLEMPPMFNLLHHDEQEYPQHIPERCQPPPSPVRNPEPSATTNNHPVVIPVATPPMSMIVHFIIHYVK